MRVTTVVLLAVVGLGRLAGAQADSSTVAAPRDGGRTSLGAWVGVARHAPGGPFGAAVGNDVSLVALRMTRTLHAGRRWALDHTADLVPAAWLSVRAEERVQLDCSDDPIPGPACRFEYRGGGEHQVYGVGAAPVGLQLRFVAGRWVQPYLGAAGGVLWFAESVPQEGAARLNFTGEAGAGLLVTPSRHLGVQVGYKLQHISNGGTRPLNPGLDSHMLHVGVMRRP